MQVRPGQNVSLIIAVCQFFKGALFGFCFKAFKKHPFENLGNLMEYIVCNPCISMFGVVAI